MAKNNIYAVIDTNVLVSALLASGDNSNPLVVMRAVLIGFITPLYNDEILKEYEEVLSREKFGFNKQDVDCLINHIRRYGLEVYRTEVNNEIFPDKKDMVFYEVALSKEEAYLVTGNIKHFPKKPFVVTPAEIINRL